MKKLKTVVKIVFIFILLIKICSCKQKETIGKTTSGETYTQAPGIVIYKTTSDYYENVPVTLSENKTILISYPAPTDLKYNDTLYRTPTKLSNNYLLDNKGVWLNSAFLKMEYKEYSTLKTTPSPKVIFNQIIDNNPFLEFYYDADNSLDTLNGKRLIEYLNMLIEKNMLTSDFKKLK